MKLIRNSDPRQDFSLEHYQEILKKILQSHKTINFLDIWEDNKLISTTEKFVIMRHDVEFSVSSALRLAEIDAAHNISSTFFLLQTSEYNPFEEETAMMIRKIISFGHDIGLHYDAGLFERIGVDAVKVAKAQVDLFESFFNIRIHAMSSHMPMRSGRTFSLPGVIDTYDPEYMVNMKYLSDSNQLWREGVVTENLSKYNHIHLTTHEFIWHPYGWDWSALLFKEVQDKFQRGWNRAENFINMYREGFKLRAEKDEEFKKRYLQK